MNVGREKLSSTFTNMKTFFVLALGLVLAEALIASSVPEAETIIDDMVIVEGKFFHHFIQGKKADVYVTSAQFEGHFLQVEK